MPRKAKSVLKQSTPAGGGFASFFSLQAGTVMSASIIFGIAFTSFWYNLSAPNPAVDTGQYASQYVVAYLFFVIVFFGTLTSSIAAFKFNTRWVLVGACVLAVAASVWFILSILSFIPSIDVYKYVCVYDRCPPTVWLFEVSWRPRSPGAVGHHDRAKDGERSGGADSTSTTSEEPGNSIGIRAYATTYLPDETLSEGEEGFTDEAILLVSPTGEINGSSVINYTAVEGGGERAPRSAFNHFEEFDVRNGSKLWAWFSWMNLNLMNKRRTKHFVSSYVPREPEPGKTDSSIGMSIFCFIILTLFWVYSLWTMFSYQKELKEQDREEAELMRLNTAGF